MEVGYVSFIAMILAPCTSVVSGCILLWVSGHSGTMQGFAQQEATAARRSRNYVSPSHSSKDKEKGLSRQSRKFRFRTK
jgi:hypothetical protein